MVMMICTIYPSHMEMIIIESFIHILIKKSSVVVHTKCAICGDGWEYTNEQFELDPFKICINCRLLGPEKPGVYIVPEGSDLPPSVHDRLFAIVPDDAIPKIFEQFFNEVDEYAKKIKEKYTRKI